MTEDNIVAYEKAVLYALVWKKIFEQLLEELAEGIHDN